jgi:hypothetical protein
MRVDRRGPESRNGISRLTPLHEGRGSRERDKKIFQTNKYRMNTKTEKLPKRIRKSIRKEAIYRLRLIEQLTRSLQVEKRFISTRFLEELQVNLGREVLGNEFAYLAMKEHREYMRG